MSRARSYSPEAWLRLRRHRLRALRFALIWFGTLGTLSAYFAVRIHHGENHVAGASFCTALFLFGLLPAYGRWKELFSTPPFLYPYFDAEVPGPGWIMGVVLLQHSRALDALCAAHGVRRIGEFVSDDDFFDKSGPTWYPAGEGLATFRALLEDSASHPAVQAAVNDLEAIRDRLLSAHSQGIQFCLLLRDVQCTNAMEWDQRKGYS